MDPLAELESLADQLIDSDSGKPVADCRQILQNARRLLSTTQIAIPDY